MSKRRGIVCMLTGELVELRGFTWHGPNAELVLTLNAIFGADTTTGHDPDPQMMMARAACDVLGGHIVADHRPPPPEDDEEVIY